MHDYFPLDIAFDDAFFNRRAEKKLLKENILSNTHTLITSPRRYGKTSLVLKVLSELNVASAQMDMMVASDAEKMKGLTLDGIGRVTAAITSGKTKIIEIARKIFQPFNTIETVEYGKLTIKFYPYSAAAPHLIILEALQRLEKLAAKVNKKAVLFFDEYQHVLEIKDALDFEASLRSFAQSARHVVCVFSGSNRHMLQAMLNDKSRPFYNMCDHIFLNRMLPKYYLARLTKLSKLQWKKPLDTDAINLIINITACHPYYVNALCRRLWRSKTRPDNTHIMEEWKSLASEKRYEISSEFERLTPIQRTILIELANKPFSHPTSKTVVQRLNASLSGITNAMNGLLERDSIYQDKTGLYRVLDPMMEYALRQKTKGFF